MQYKIVINEVWEAVHIVEADTKEEAIEKADLEDDGKVSHEFITSTEESSGGVQSVEGGDKSEASNTQA